MAYTDIKHIPLAKFKRVRPLIDLVIESCYELKSE